MRPDGESVVSAGVGLSYPHPSPTAPEDTSRICLRWSCDSLRIYSIRLPRRNIASAPVPPWVTTAVPTLIV